MATRTEAYVDTSAFIAFVDSSDSHHTLFNRLFGNPPKLVTTPLVIAEGHGWFLRRYDRYRALQFIGLIESLDIVMRVVNPTHADRASSFELLRRYSDQDLTLVDAMGLQVMSARQIAVCWSTDFHLGLTGVPLAIHSQ